MAQAISKKSLSLLLTQGSLNLDLGLSVGGRQVVDWDDSVQEEEGREVRKVYQVPPSLPTRKWLEKELKAAIAAFDSVVIDDVVGGEYVIGDMRVVVSLSERRKLGVKANNCLGRVIGGSYEPYVAIDYKGHCFGYDGYSGKSMCLAYENKNCTLSTEEVENLLAMAKTYWPVAVEYSAGESRAEDEKRRLIWEAEERIKEARRLLKVHLLLKQQIVFYVEDWREDRWTYLTSAELELADFYRQWDRWEEYGGGYPVFRRWG